jgi:hypothetical protein
MSYLSYSKNVERTPVHERIMANLQVQASWLDETTGKSILIEGTTENLGETSALVCFETLPPVGSEVHLRILDEERTLIDTSAAVIRVQRDPSKPLAALSIVDNIKAWKEDVLTVAQEWVVRQWKLNYEEEYVN